MHRDPRHAEAERIIGALTICPGASVLITLAFGWDSMLLKWLDGGWRWTWIALFCVFGGAMIVASNLWDVRLRLRLLYLCAAAWVAIGIASIALQLPVSLAMAVVIALSCLRAARRIRNGRD